MTTLPDLKQLEKDTFRRFYEDGLMDIFFGMMLVTMAAGTFLTDRLDSEWMGMTLMLVVAISLVTVLQVQRKRLLRDRLGQFVPGPGRRKKIRLTRLALLASVAVGVVMFIVLASMSNDRVDIVSIEIVLPVVWFLNAVVVLGAMAHFLDVPRLYLYGFLFGVALPLLILPDVLWDVRIPAWIAFGGPGVVMVAIGAFLLTRFLSNYPPLEQERGEDR